MATCVSKHQLEHLSLASVSPLYAGSLTLRFADWRALGTVLPECSSFSSIICVDPATTCLICRSMLPAFFAQQRARLHHDGRLTMLVFTISPDKASGMGELGAFFGGCVVRGGEIASREEVCSAAEGVGLLWRGAVKVEGGLGGHVAATMRQWRLRLVAKWRDARLLGATDTDLRRCELLM
jgi:cyclopropane fatty-acyl-phospholipid synthase-like methyltransferase